MGIQTWDGRKGEEGRGGYCHSRPKQPPLAQLCSPNKIFSDGYIIARFGNLSKLRYKRGVACHRANIDEANHRSWRRSGGFSLADGRDFFPFYFTRFLCM